jgi:hypothetical protein
MQGMRIVNNESEFSESLSSAQREALAAFGNSQVLIEKYLLKPRHIEVQVFLEIWFLATASLPLKNVQSNSYNIVSYGLAIVT